MYIRMVWLKFPALQKYMQQIAREDSDSYGATYAKA